jgi:hypothetical protein
LTTRLYRSIFWTTSLSLWLKPKEPSAGAVATPGAE